MRRLHHAGTATPLAELWQHVQPAVVVAFGSLPPTDAQSLQRAEIPLLNGVFTPGGTRLTGLSQEDIGRLQIEHLAARGHRHIGYGPVEDPRERPFCQPRLRGATRACDELGLPAPQVVSMRYSRSSARDAVAGWTQGPVPVTAVAAFNDLIALAVLANCRTQHIAVPDDLALIGVDNLPVSSLAVPALTTIGMDLTAAAGNLTAGILSTVGAPAPEAPSRPAAGDILALIRRETT